MFRLFDAFMDKGKESQSNPSHAVSDDSLQRSLITEEQLERALLLQKKDKSGLIHVLSDMGLLSQEDLINISNLKLFAIPSIRLSELLVEKGALRMISRKMAAQHLLIPVRLEKGTLVVAMADPMDLSAIEKVRTMTGLLVKPFHAEGQDIIEHINKLYEEQDSMDDFRGSVEEFAGTVEEVEDREDEPSVSEIQVAVKSSPVVKMLNIILTRAVEKRASDIHIEVYRDATVIRFRIDGALIDFTRIPRAAHTALVSRVKIIAGMDISENRRPQDGKCRFVICNQEVDFRVSTMRTVHGEKVVIRILNKTAGTFSLDSAGFSPHNYQRVVDILSRPFGMFAVTGPTGSGKTTTLYSILKRIVTSEKNAVTVEDPVEYELERINQVPINVKADLTFASALKSILRQDPDIIMIGEIRDRETAEIAVQASLTGHYVLSTLHTNDAPGAVSRLIDLGIPPFLVAYSVVGVIAQRLLRKLCPACREQYSLSDNIRAGFHPSFVLPDTIWRTRGCEECSFTGFRGRLALHEVLLMSPALEELIVTSANLRRDIFDVSCREGMKTLREDALDKVARGETTLEQALTAT